MNQNIGINMNKILDSITKRVRVPAITQRQYYKDYSINEENMKFYNLDDDPDYLDEDEDVEECEKCNSQCCEDEYYEDEYGDDDCCCMEKLMNLDKGKIMMLGIGVLVGAIGTCILKNRR